MSKKIISFARTWQGIISVVTTIVMVAGIGWSAQAMWGHTQNRIDTVRAEANARIDQNQNEIEIVGLSVKQLKDDQEWQEFLSLNKLRQAFGLDENQFKIWCKLAIRLKARSSCPVYKGRMKRSD